MRTWDLNHDGAPDVILETWSGGAHGSQCYYVWSLGRKPRCLLAYDKDDICDDHNFDIVDLDGDGQPEIRSWYDGFAYTVGQTCSEDLPVVLRYEGGRFVDRTSRYRKLLQRASHKVWGVREGLRHEGSTRFVVGPIFVCRELGVSGRPNRCAQRSGRGQRKWSPGTSSRGQMIASHPSSPSFAVGRIGTGTQLMTNLSASTTSRPRSLG